jgi:aldehyde dehydrogenase (NAD+)
VFADADLERAVPGAGMACFNNSGQICYAGTRLLVQRGIADEFVARLAAFGRTLKVGDGMNPRDPARSANLQPTTQHSFGYFDLARAEGARVVSGGERLGGDLANGYFVPPTVLSGVTNDMRVAREEIFARWFR